MAKGSIRIAKRYAKALIALYEPSQLESVRESLKAISQIWSENSLLQNSLLNPANSVQDRQEVLKALAGKVRSGDTNFLNFLLLLLESKRLSSISMIAEAFSQLVDELKKLLSLKVSSASQVSEDEMNSFKSKIEKDFGSLVTVDWEIDKDLIGGLRVRSGDRLLDGSVRGILERLSSSLTA